MTILMGRGDGEGDVAEEDARRRQAGRQQPTGAVSVPSFQDCRRARDVQQKSRAVKLMATPQQSDRLSPPISVIIYVLLDL
jgi:hypothetical protein